ncbi:MAG: ABC-2 family transporter protein [bacterium]|nr:ABC-2 family transporter protein [bacterium]
MKNYLDIYWTFFKTNIATQFQYRAEMSIWLISRVLEPTIYLVVWITVANARGGSLGGYTPSDFAAYYIVLMLVNQFTFTWIMHEYEYRIRHGALSALLLKPIHPIHSDIADNIAYKALTAVIIFPTAFLLYVLFDPTFNTDLETFLLFLPSLFLAFFIRFFEGWILALTAFWTTRNDALNQMYFALSLFLSGRIAPISLLPGWTQSIADFFPFRWTIAFPTELALGRLTPEEIQTGFLAQILWLVLMTALLKFVWRSGVKQYSAVGS